MHGLPQFMLMMLLASAGLGLVLFLLFRRRPWTAFWISAAVPIAYSVLAMIFTNSFSLALVRLGGYVAVVSYVGAAVGAGAALALNRLYRVLVRGHRPE